MIELIFKTSVIFSLAAAANALLRRLSAAHRHSVWMLAFLAVPLVAAFSYVWAGVTPPVSLAALTHAAKAAQSTSVSYTTPIWMTGTAFLLLRLLVSYGRLYYQRDDVAVPLTFGIFRPAIFLPKSAERWPLNIRRSVILHEEAHIGRHDTLAHFFVQLVCAFLWYQPLAWYAAGKAAEERERACDDVVVHSGVPALEYAAHLVEVARESPTANMAGVAMVRESSLARRLRAILDDSLSRAPISLHQRVAFLCVAAVILPGVAALTGGSEKIYQMGDARVILPKVIRKVEPEYTREARADKIAGSVTVSMEISPEGSPQYAKVVSGLNSGLDKNAVDAVNRWRFDPARRDGAPVAFAAKIKVDFKLR